MLILLDGYLQGMLLYLFLLELLTSLLPVHEVFKFDLERQVSACLILQLVFLAQFFFFRFACEHSDFAVHLVHLPIDIAQVLLLAHLHTQVLVHVCPILTLDVFLMLHLDFILLNTLAMFNEHLLVVVLAFLEFALEFQSCQVSTATSVLVEVRDLGFVEARLGNKVVLGHV